VVNSFDGRDVVSGIYYAAVKNDTIIFATPSSTAQSIYAQVGSNQNVLLIQSTTTPVIAGLADGLTSQGDTVQTIQSDDPMQTNMNLAALSGASKFVIVDPVYGYNTVSALAYAKLNGMYLLFVDQSNADLVASFMKNQSVVSVLIYGYVDQAVINSLNSQGLPYTQINNGDKFADNMQLDDMYFAMNPSKKQIILSDGNAFDSTMAAGDDPVLLISPVVPDSVYQYLENKVSTGQISAAMLVDQSYAQTAYNLKTSINKDLGSDKLSVFVKFGQSTGSGGLGQVELFPLPGPTLGLDIDAVQYDTRGQELEVTYNNTGNALEYVKSSIMVYADGAYTATVGDQQPIPIEAGQVFGVSYPVTITSGAVTANITTYFGSSKLSFENGIQTMRDAGDVQFNDTSLLGITGFDKDQATDDLFVTYTNTGNVTEYFTASATIVSNGTSTIINDDNTYTLPPAQGKMVKFPGIATDGVNITASAEYGARQAFLDKTVQKEYVPGQAAAGATGIDPVLLGGAFIILVIIVALYLFFRKGKETKEKKN
jgi:hypothetical protein